MQLQNLINKWKKNIDREIKKHSYKNLVFKGGGVRGIAYLGAVEALEEYEMMDKFERVAGTSAGAISAMLVSLRLKSNELADLFNSLEMQKIPQAQTNGKKPLLFKQSRVECYDRLFENYGWYSSQYFYDWLQDVIAIYCNDNPRATFANFREMGCLDLHIVASNLTRHRAEVFSYDNTPHVAVADAVRMSMSIPFFFESLQFDGEAFGSGDYYVDGGVYDNYPIHVFDTPKYAKNNLRYSEGVNWETLGCFLYPMHMEENSQPDKESNPNNFWNYVEMTINNLYDSHQIMPYENHRANHQRSILISDMGIKPTQFSISPECEEYELLVNSGRKAVHEFLNPAP
jgi:NTE family protein